MTERFAQQLRFLTEIDKMKGILRQTILIDESRQETDAEHSWHFAMMAMILAEYAHAPEVDIARVIRMALVHDLVEIYAGDTYAYDEVGCADQRARETAAADKLFALLPEDQGAMCRALWEEFDLLESADALYANAMDCVQPLLNNYMTKGKTWQKNKATSDRVYKRMERVKKGAPRVYVWIVEMIEESVAKGYLMR